MVNVGASSWNPSAGLSVSNSYASATTLNSKSSGLTVDLYYTGENVFTEQITIYSANNLLKGDSYHSAYHSSYPDWYRTLSRLAS